jgi:recombination protein RecR
MHYRPPAFDRLAEAIRRLPSIGPRTASRIALWLVTRPETVSREIAESLVAERTSLAPCPTCFQLAEKGICPVCSDPDRDPTLLCIVEEAPNVWSFERTGRFRGLYHVLGGALSPLDGVGPDELTFEALLVRLRDPDCRINEVIMATDPDTEGNATALYLVDLLKPFHLKITRLAHGLPVGAELSFSDDATLAEALAGRTELKA